MKVRIREDKSDGVELWLERTDDGVTLRGKGEDGTVGHWSGAEGIGHFKYDDAGRVVITKA